VSGSDLKIYVTHIRKQEADQLAKSAGAAVVYLKAEKKAKTK
jgi:hypothetical protein